MWMIWGPALSPPLPTPLPLRSPPLSSRGGTLLAFLAARAQPASPDACTSNPTSYASNGGDPAAPATASLTNAPGLLPGMPGRLPQTHQRGAPRLLPVPVHGLLLRPPGSGHEALPYLLLVAVQGGTGANPDADAAAEPARGAHPPGRYPEA